MRHQHMGSGQSCQGAGHPGARAAPGGRGPGPGRPGRRGRRGRLCGPGPDGPDRPGRPGPRLRRQPHEPTKWQNRIETLREGVQNSEWL